MTVTRCIARFLSPILVRCRLWYLHLTGIILRRFYSGLNELKFEDLPVRKVWTLSDITVMMMRGSHNASNTHNWFSFLPSCMGYKLFRRPLMPL